VERTHRQPMFLEEQRTLLLITKYTIVVFDSNYKQFVYLVNNCGCFQFSPDIHWNEHKVCIWIPGVRTWRFQTATTNPYTSSQVWEL